MRRTRDRAILVATALVVIGGAAALPAQASSRSAPAGGGPLWVARYNGTGNDDDVARSLVVSPDGSRVFVTGYSYGANGWKDYVTAAYHTATGTLLWLARYDGPASTTDEAVSIGVSPDGSRVFVTGRSTGIESDVDFATLSYDTATGDLVWEARYGPGQADAAAALVVSPDGSAVFVTGAIGGGIGSTDFATVAYDATTGSMLWDSLYNGGRADGAKAIAVSPDGSKVFVTGGSQRSVLDNDMATVGYDAATGSRLWQRRYGGPPTSWDGGNAIAVSPDGSRVFVAGQGQTNGSTSTYDYLTLAYTETGAPVWFRRYDGPRLTDDEAHALAVSPDGSKVFVTGWSDGLSGNSPADIATVAYGSATGSQLWVGRIAGPGNQADLGYSVALTPGGSAVVVAGATASGGSYDYATGVHDASTGALLGVRGYAGPGGDDDLAQSVGVSPDGSMVFVTGYSTGEGTGFDYATVAYAVVRRYE